MNKSAFASIIANRAARDLPKAVPAFVDPSDECEKWESAIKNSDAGLLIELMKTKIMKLSYKEQKQRLAEIGVTSTSDTTGNLIDHLIKRVQDILHMRHTSGALQAVPHNIQMLKYK